MGKNNNIIIINGKQYDAVTGDLIGGSAPKKVLAAVKAPVSKIARHPAKHAVKHKTQNSKTLMRHAVKKPADSLKRHTKAQSGNGAIAKHAAASVITKASVHKLDDKRLKHAQKVTKSNLVTRFAPVSLSASEHHRVAHEAKLHAKVIVAHHMPPVSPAKTTADLLQRALDQATSHQQTYAPTKEHGKSGRIARMSVIAVALLVVMGFATTQGMSAVRLHVASSKAGFEVNTPDYKPAGYSLSQFNYSAGNADLLFSSNSDDRAFSINQKASDWDSGTLRDLVVAPAGNNYQTIESAGRTIFLDSNNNATWVSGGVLYEVNSDGILNEQQLIKIADSL